MPDVFDAPAVKSREVLSYIDDPVARYVEGLELILEAEELRSYLEKWPFLAQDAIEQARGLKDADVVDMQKNRKNEAQGERMATRYGGILLPVRMMTLLLLSERYKAPVGAVYLRMWVTGEHDRLMNEPKQGGVMTAKAAATRARKVADGFVELTVTVQAAVVKATLSVAAIKLYRAQGDNTLLVTTDGGEMEVHETYEEVDRKIQESGRGKAR